MKVSLRLSQIDKLVTKHYDHIWDCCCDHGFLGAKLLQRNAAKTIHFVDMVEELMLELASKLQQFSLPHFQLKTDGSPKWKVHCIDVAALPLNTYRDSETHLIIIAGVGGDLLIQLVSQILTRHPDKHLEFILCPVHHNYKVREAMAQLQLGLVHECLLKENKRFYEIMHLSTQSQESLSKVGSHMWDLSRADDKQYLANTLAHYQRIQKNIHTDNEQIAKIIAHYHKITEQTAYIEAV